MSVKNYDYVFISPGFPLPRMIKRIKCASTLGKTCVVFWNKGVLNFETKLPGDVDIFEINEKANEGATLKRIFPTLRFYKKAISILKTFETNCIHVSKTDMLVLTKLYVNKLKNPPYVIYEVSDLHSLAYNSSKKFVDKLKRSLLLRVEDHCSKIVNTVLITSESFWSNYYNRIYEPSQKFYFPNVPDENIFKDYKPKDKNKYTVGFIGSVRYPKQLETLFIAAKKTRVSVFIAGDGLDLDRLKSFADNNACNVEFYGKYDYENDIAKLYSRINCVYAVYDTDIANTKIALPNRLYEGTICGLPLIAAEGTLLGNIVSSNSIGYVVKDGDLDQLVQAITALKNADTEMLASNALSYASSNSYTHYAEELSHIYMTAKSKEIN